MMLPTATKSKRKTQALKEQSTTHK
jgi:hypothetical protein